MKRKAQGAIEYLFMIAAALIIILIVVRQLQGRTNTATQTIQDTSGSLEGNLTDLSNNA